MNPEIEILDQVGLYFVEVGVRFVGKELDDSLVSEGINLHPRPRPFPSGHTDFMMDR